MFAIVTPARLPALAGLVLAIGGCGGRSEHALPREHAGATRECPSPDEDGDCHAPLEAGGDDCDDHAPTRYPGAPDNGPGEYVAQPFVPWSDIPHPFALAQGPGGDLHVLACDGSGWYATERGGAWQFLALPSNAPSAPGCDLWADGDGLHVAYVDKGTDNHLFYAHHPGLAAPNAEWESELAVTGANVAGLALWRGAGRTWLGYVQISGAIVLAEREQDGWRTERVAAIRATLS